MWLTGQRYSPHGWDAKVAWQGLEATDYIKFTVRQQRAMNARTQPLSSLLYTVRTPAREWYLP